MNPRKKGAPKEVTDKRDEARSTENKSAETTKRRKRLAYLTNQRDLYFSGQKPSDVEVPGLEEDDEEVAQAQEQAPSEYQEGFDGLNIYSGEYGPSSKNKKEQQASIKTEKPRYPDLHVNNKNIYQKSKVKGNSQLQYKFVLPDGSRSNQQIQIINSGGPVTVSEVKIVTNANIQSPWGAWAYGSTISCIIDLETGLYEYTISFPNGYTIPNGTTDVLDYSVTETGNIGPYSAVAMPPQSLSIDGGDVVNFYAANPEPNPHDKMKFAMYHAQWGQYAYKKDVSNEEWQDINSISYAFNGFDADGNVKSLDSWADNLELPLLALQKQARPYLDFSLSFGGWTNNNQPMDVVFSQMASDPAKRANFVRNVIRALKQTGANGVDIDWEYVLKDDAENYISLLTELRQAMVAADIKNPKVTTTAPAGQDKIKELSADQWQRVSKQVDELRVMAYDFFGGFSQYCDFHAPWQLSPNSPDYDTGYDTKTALDLYTGKGEKDMHLDPSKMSLGMPNYGRAVIVQSLGATGAGLYEKVIGTPQGDFPGANGIYSWKSIFDHLSVPPKPSPLDELGVKKWHYYDETSPLCQDAKMCLMVGELPDGTYVVLNYLSPANAAWRAQQARQMGYGGVMAWANYFETDDPKNSISNAISNGILPDAKPVPTAANEWEKRKQAIDRHLDELNDAFFANRKVGTLTELKVLTEQSNYKGVAEVIEKNKARLGQHRNIFKRVLSAMGMKFEKPKSLQLAEALLSTLQPTAIFDAPFAKQNGATNGKSPKINKGATEQGFKPTENMEQIKAKQMAEEKAIAAKNREKGMKELQKQADQARLDRAGISSSSLFAPTTLMPKGYQSKSANEQEMQDFTKTNNGNKKFG